MKKVAGRLRLELSQYRELEAFAQFGSELDADTQATLARGERLVATLNQDERNPWPIEDQVAAIYAGTGGYLDRIKTERVTEFLDMLLARLHSEKQELMDKIADGEWDDDIEARAGRRDRRGHRRLRPRLRRGGQPDRGGRVRPHRLRGRAPARGPHRRGPRERRRRRRRRRATSDEPEREEQDGSRLVAHGQPEGHPGPHRVGQEHPQDHAGDGDGGRRAAAPRRAADRGAAPLRRRAPADDAARLGGRGRTSPTCRSSRSARTRRSWESCS